MQHLKKGPVIKISTFGAAADQGWLELADDLQLLMGT